MASFQKFYFPYFQREATERCALLKYEEVGLHHEGEVKGILRPKKGSPRTVAVHRSRQPVMQTRARELKAPEKKIDGSPHI